MSFKKLLGIISIVIVVVFSMMLTTSYAWYAFDNASTTFNGVTTNDDIIVSYQKGEYINTSIAVPISSDAVDTFADKNEFSINVKEAAKDFELAVTISLMEVSIATELKNTRFMVDLLYQDDVIKTVNGTDISSNSIELATVTLDNDIANDFQLRVYILDDGTDQTGMMNKTFQAKIQVNVVSRLKTSKRNYKDADIYVSTISIDGEEKNYLPTDGYYNMTYSCTKGSTLSWEPLSKTLTYNSGSYVVDECSLSFTSADENTDYPLLSEMPVGSYVKYTGNNGCSGKACEGQNANYVSDTKMGYCGNEKYQFYANGWRIGYKENGNVYLISAGAPECINTYIGDKSSTVSSGAAWGTAYYYGSGYKFDNVSGKYTLTGITPSTLAWGSNYEGIIKNTPYTCKETSSTGVCSGAMYEVTADSSSTIVNYYIYEVYEQTSKVPKHLEHLNNVALTYCNKDYAKNGVCDSTTSWAMNASDFQKITGGALSSDSCFYKYSDMSCGYTNDLIDNGGYYWVATLYDSLSYYVFYWSPYYRFVGNYYSSNVIGVRPILKLESSVIVTGGSGTYDDPYTIGVG